MWKHHHRGELWVGDITQSAAMGIPKQKNTHSFTIISVFLSVSLSLSLSVIDYGQVFCLSMTVTRSGVLSLSLSLSLSPLKREGCAGLTQRQEGCKWPLANQHVICSLTKPYSNKTREKKKCRCHGMQDTHALGGFRWQVMQWIWRPLACGLGKSLQGTIHTLHSTRRWGWQLCWLCTWLQRGEASVREVRSEEHTSELQSR